LHPAAKSPIALSATEARVTVMALNINSIKLILKQ
jgi:hypothetical protein